MTEPQPQRPYVGIILLLIKDDKLLLQQRCTKDDLNNLYAPVAGKIDMHESPTQAAIREAYEEAGILIKPEHLKLVCIAHWTDRKYKNERIDAIEFYYTVSHYEGTPKVMEPDKAISIDFYPIDKLPETLVTSIPKVLTAINNNVPYLEWQGDF